MMGDKCMPDLELMDLFYEVDTRKHQQLVAEKMVKCAKRLLDKGMAHDASKFSEIEKRTYTEPVWKLNHNNVEYGSEKYNRLVAQMDEGWEHHIAENDHHPQWFEKFGSQTLDDPIKAMDMFALIEMLCDWIAASRRNNSRACDAMRFLKKKYPLDSQIECILNNTLDLIENKL